MKTLVLVDIQNDFCLDGALEVEDGDAIVEVANKLMKADVFDLVVATQDWHPQNHGSFASNQGTQPFTVGELNGLPQVWWPDHCVWGSHGAEFHPELNMDKVAGIIRKGMRPGVDSYSGFLDNDKNLDTQTGLGSFIEGPDGNDEIYIMGLATDYCVKYTVLDSIDFAFDTYLIVDGCRGVNMDPNDSHKAVEEMKNAGATIVSSKDLLNV
jgi:nicotinamidase/pyrazinamidase